MDESERLKEIIMSFRVYELQQLLGYARVNRTGNKPELQRRALNLVRKPQQSIVVKIYEIQRSTQSKAKTLTEKYSRDPVEPPQPLSSKMNSSDLTSWLQGVSKTKQKLAQRMEQLNAMTSEYGVAATTAGNKSYSMPYGGQPVLSLPIQPDVRFKRLPFCDELSELLRASSLQPLSNARMQVSHFDFHLTPQQVIDIGQNRVMNGNKMENIVQVQLRIGLLETTCEQSDMYPPHLAVRVNNRLCQLPVPAPPNRPLSETKHYARPLDITAQLRLSPTTTNSLTIEWVSEYGRSYAVRVALIRKLTANELLRRLRVHGYKPAEYTRSLIKEKLAADEDNEISCSSWRVSVSCPLSKCRMKEPCRPIGCRHLQCFDASMYLKMNECKPSWLCPICDKPAPYDELVLDGYFSEILNSPRLTESDDLFIDCDGSWHQAAANTNEKEKADYSDFVILDETDPVLETKLKEDIEDTADEPSSNPKEDTFVDLTLSDSEDDIPLSILAKSLRYSMENSDMQQKDDLTRKLSTDSDIMFID